MLENNKPLPKDGELSDVELDLVSGGDQKPVVKPKPKPTATSGGGGNTFNGVDGESSHDVHKGEIEILA